MDEAVEVFSRFDRCWHPGFRVHEIESTGSRPRVRLRRGDDTVLPGSFDAADVRPADPPGTARRG